MKFITQHRGTAVQARRGFTLIELLVVIAIISLLVSILLPSLNKAKDLARRVACSSNLRNIALGAAFYADEYDVYPTGRRVDWAENNTSFFLQEMDYSSAVALLEIMGENTLANSTGDITAQACSQSSWLCPAKEPEYWALYWPRPGQENEAFRPPAFSYMMQAGLKQSPTYRYYGSMSPTRPSDPIGPLVADNVYCFQTGAAPYTLLSNHLGDGIDGVAGFNQAYSDGHAEWQDVEKLPDTAPAGGWMYRHNGTSRAFFWVE